MTQPRDITGHNGVFKCWKGAKSENWNCKCQLFTPLFALTLHDSRVTRASWSFTASVAGTIYLMVLCVTLWTHSSKSKCPLPLQSSIDGWIHSHTSEVCLSSEGTGLPSSSSSWVELSSQFAVLCVFLCVCVSVCVSSSPCFTGWPCV